MQQLRRPKKDNAWKEKTTWEGLEMVNIRKRS